MDAQLFRELVSRWVSGDRLTPAEQRRMLDWLANHPEARGELLEDEATDSLLRCWPRLDDTAEDFVRECLQRVAGAGADRGEPVSAPAAPPIAEPPAAAVVRPAKTASDARRGRRIFAGGGRWAAALAGCSAALLLAAIGWRWLARGPQAVETIRPASPAQDILATPLAENQGSRPEPDRAFATLAQSAGAAWETPRSEGDRLAEDILKLTAGTAELHFDKGSVARLTGPAVLELRSGEEVYLERGSLTTRVPPQAVGFVVATPLAQIVDLGTEFDVVVEESGATQTVVRQGHVSFRPQRGQEDLAGPIELAAGALDHAAISVPDVAAPVLPVMTIASGSQGRFLGRLSANGKTVEFHSPTAFHEFQALTLKQLREAPSQFGQKWPALADGAGGGSGGNVAPPKSTPERREVPPPHVARPSPAADVAGGKHGSAGPGTVAAGRTVEIRENGKTFSISDSKESGITVTITESVGGKKKMTEVHAANAAELAKKNPEAHRLYHQYFHPRPKTAKPK